jgi:hypothetical protein
MSNRYDDITVSGYTPQTMQELAFVPMMKREKHDKLLAENELIRAGIAKVDPLKFHYDTALELKKGIESELDNTATELSKHGINNDMIGKTIALNRKYQDLVSPMGEFGKINAAKAIFNKEHDDYIKNATEVSKIGKDQAEKNWNNYVENNYTGFKDGKITNIEPLGAPAYQDYGQYLSRAHSILGKTIEGISSAGHHLEYGPDGSFWEVTRNGDRIKSKNTDQVQAALNSALDTWDNPNGEGKKWATHAGIGLNKDRIINDFNSMLENSDINKISESANYNAPPKPEKSDEEGPAGQIISNDTEIKSDATNYEEYSDVLSEIKRLSSSKSLNPADQAKLDDLIELRREADAKLTQNKDYKANDITFKKEYSKWERLAKKMNMTQEEVIAVKKDPSILPRLLFSKGVGSFKGKQSDPDLKLIMQDKDLSYMDKILSQRKKLKNDAWQKSSSLRHNYSYMPSTPKEEGEWNLHNENVATVLKGIPNISSVLDLTGVQTTGGFRKDVTDEDVANIQDLLKNSDQKSFKISNIKTYGDNKSPEITAVFTTNEDANEYDTQGVKRKDEYGGSKKQVTVTFKLKRFTNSADTGSAPGYKNLTGAIANFYKNKGTVNGITGNFQGQEVYTSLVNNAYADLTNKELAARYNSDSDAQQALNYRAIKRGVKPSQLLTKYPNNKN